MHLGTLATYSSNNTCMRKSSSSAGAGDARGRGTPRPVRSAGQVKSIQFGRRGYFSQNQTQNARPGWKLRMAPFSRPLEPYRLPPPPWRQHTREIGLMRRQTEIGGGNTIWKPKWAETAVDFPSWTGGRHLLRPLGAACDRFQVLVRPSPAVNAKASRRPSVPTSTHPLFGGRLPMLRRAFREPVAW